MSLLLIMTVITNVIILNVKSMELNINMKPKYVMHESIGEVIKDLTEMYDEGKIDGICVIVNRADNTDVWFSWAKFNYLERLGVSEFLRSESVAKMKKDDI